MMASLSKIPQPAEPPTLIIKGLPQWVTEQPASMRIFFETFGVLRAFDVAHGEVSLQFENCYKALRLLCACSLHLESVVQGDTLVDYVLTWKEKRALEEEENLSFSPILKKPLLEPSATKNELEKHHGYQLEAGEVRKLNTKFQIGLVDHKHEEKTNDKDNFIQQLLMEKRNLEEKIVKLEKKKEKMGAKMKDFCILASKHAKGEKLAFVWLIVSWILFSIVLYRK
ncbi:unnamed protein product [Cuscuta epithymum]|uniref:RRM domain-containing protein n=1 Tax=Cuscuta epithymum TaxID=186058 RepID=A0AAV0GIZ1_9ASTE|nr:unnamed protein product [Cuscuta epithymum]CAH9147543.1 unnamed protein product [Cuscuta epithymum]